MGGEFVCNCLISTYKDTNNISLPQLLSIISYTELTLNLGKCSESTKNKFVSQLSNAKFKDYQKIDTIKIDSTRAIVYIKQNKETISDIVFASLGPKLYNYIHLKGDLKLSELKHYLPKEDKKEKQN